MEKGVQSENTMLIHSPWRFGRKKKLKIKYKIPSYVPYKENILVLPGEELLDYLDFTQSEKNEFLNQLWDAYNKAKKQKTLKEFFEE